jgi:hypothetical protein
MALVSRTAAEKAEGMRSQGDSAFAALSPEEAERFAAMIRPSWEVALTDGEVDAAPVEPSETAPPPIAAAAEPVIRGIPTVSVGEDPEPRAAARVENAAGESDTPEPQGMRSRRSVDEPRDAAPSAPTSANGAGPKSAALAPPASTSKIRSVQGAAAARAHAQPSRIAEDPIEIPVVRSSGAAILKVAIAVVGLLALFFAGRAILRSGDEGAAVTPEPTAKPADPPPAAPSPTLAQTAAPPATAAAPATATATAAAPATATARATATAAAPATAAATKSSPGPATAAPAPPSATAKTATTTPATAAPPPTGTAKQAGPPPPPSGSKKGDGIIRDAPF